jgi:hypothetical protein
MKLKNNIFFHFKIIIINSTKERSTLTKIFFLTQNQKNNRSKLYQILRLINKKTKFRKNKS